MVNGLKHEFVEIVLIATIKEPVATCGDWLGQRCWCRCYFKLINFKLKIKIQQFNLFADSFIRRKVINKSESLLSDQIRSTD